MMMTTMKNWATLAVVFASLTGVGAAQASPGNGDIELRYQSLANGLTTTLHLPLQVNAASYVLGNYNFQTRDLVTHVPTGSFIAYCVDPYQWASSSYHAYTVTPLSASTS